jgi:seryl-tRNA synthetase
VFEIKVPLQTSLSADAAKNVLEQVRYLHEKVLDVKLDAACLTLCLEDGHGVDIDAMAENVSELVKSIKKSFAKDFEETLHSSTHIPPYTENPWDWLVKSGQVIPIQASVCYLSGDLAELLECADLLFKNYARSLGATLQCYTAMIRFGAFVDNGYLNGFPQHAFFVASAHQSLSALQSIARLQSPDSTPEKSLLGPVQYILSPTVCYHCFEALRGSTLKGREVFSARSLCHRNEIRQDASLLRLQAFNMREIIFYGDAMFVEATRDQVLKYCLTLFDGLKLKYRVQTASDPFFTSGSEQRRVFQKISRSKLELQLYIPHSGSWVSVASFNHHATTLTGKYAIGPMGLNSGCFGVGYERLLYGMIAQLGCDIQALTSHVGRAAQSSSVAIA